MLHSVTSSPFLRAGLFFLVSIGLRLGWGFTLYYGIGDAGQDPNSTTLTSAEVGYVSLALLFTVLLPLFHGAFLAALASSFNTSRRLVKAGFLSFACAIPLTMTSITWQLFLQPQNTFNQTVADGDGGVIVDPLWQVLGAMAFSVEVLCLLSSFTALYHTTRTLEPDGPGEVAPLGWRKAFTLPWAPTRVVPASLTVGGTLGTLGLALGLPLFLSMLLPPAWATACETWASYATNPLKPPVPAYTLLSPTLQWDLSYFFPASVHMTPPSAVWVQLYVDVGVYYGVLGGVILAGVVGLAWRPARKLLRARLFIASLPSDPLSALLPAPALTTLYAPSVGEALLLACWLGLIVFWGWYWGWGYQRIQDQSSGDTVSQGQQVAARALGHMCTLFLSLAVLPLSKGSVWEKVFGVPYERALAFHRLNSMLFWLMATAHGATWVFKWSRNGLALYNLTATGSPSPMCLSNNDPDSPTADCHANNFTIPIMAAAWGVMTVSVLVAIFRRRVPWEYFVATHNYLLWVILAAEVHAWSHWYHTLGALALYALDRAHRSGKSAVEYRVLTLTPLAEEVTLVEALLPFGAPAASPPPPPGAFYYVCIPTLHSQQWHPFTASDFCRAQVEGGRGRGGDGGEEGDSHKLSFSIRSMGPNTWSGQLFALAASASTLKPSSSASLHHILLSGPHGALTIPPDTSNVLAVAGGIGITPFLALASSLVQAYLGGEEGEGGGSRVSTGSGYDLLDSEMESLNSVNLGGGRSEGFFASGGWGGSGQGLLLHQQQRGGGRIPHLTLVWSVQRADMLGVGAEVLCSLMDVATHGGVTLVIHITGDSAATATPVEEWPAVVSGVCSEVCARRLFDMAERGRPDLEAIAEDFSVRKGERVVLACGPTSLSLQAMQVAQKRGWEVHTEVFHL